MSTHYTLLVHSNVKDRGETVFYMSRSGWKDGAASAPCFNTIMSKLERFLRFYYRTRARIHRTDRMIFPSPAELKFVELMGGHIVRMKWLHSPFTHFPAAIIVSKGKLLRSENFRREVRYGRYYADFANDLHRIIEIDSKRYHMDVVADMDRDIYIKSRFHGAQILRLRTFEISANPTRTQQQVIKFLTY